MQRIFDIALNDLRIIFKDRGIWLNLVVIPIVLSIAIGFANGAGNTAPTNVTIRIDVLSNDPSPEAARLVNAVRDANPNFVLCPMDQNEEDVCQLGENELTADSARERLEAKTALATLEIPEGFGAALNAGEAANVIYRSNETAAAPSYILQAVQGAATRMGGAQVAAQVGAEIANEIDYLQFADDADRTAFVDSIRNDAAAMWVENPVSVRLVQGAEADSANSGAGGFSQSIPGMAAMYVLFAVLPATSAFILERKNWTLQRLASMPVSRTQILAGKLLARFVLGMIQYAILFGFGALVLGVNFGSDPLALIVVMVAYTLCITALALALTTFITSDQQAQGIVLFLSLVLAPLGGAWWSLEIVPAWMRIVGHVSPIAWVMDGHREIIFFGGGLGDVLLPIAVLLAMTAGLFAVGVARFRFTN